MKLTNATLSFSERPFVDTLTHDQIWGDIFERQTQLFVKYGPIYEARGFYYPSAHAVDNVLVILPDVNNPHFQNWVKTKLWCCAEEISEMQVELKSRPIDTNKVSGELIDVLHFHTEISLVLGYKSVPRVLRRGKRSPMVLPHNIEKEVKQYLFSLGQLGHTLRNKPWKQTPVETNTDDMKTKLMLSWANLMGIFEAAGMSLDDVYSMYVAKHEINEQRQQEKY